MDITYTEDERLLKEQARRFLEDACPPAVVRAAEQDWQAGRDLWRRVAELGWWSAALPAPSGGSGFAVACLLAEEMGRNLLPGPVAETVALVSGLAKTETLRAWVEQLAGGSALGTLAAKEQANPNWPDSET